MNIGQLLILSGIGFIGVFRGSMFIGSALRWFR